MTDPVATVTERACISYWLPRLIASDVAVPETKLIFTAADLIRMLDGEAVPGVLFLIEGLRTAARAVGYPCFLRTGHGSDKHNWRDTCLIEWYDDFPSHVGNLVEWSAMVDLPTKVWAVRKMLALHSSFTAFNGLPINRERRYFVNDGRVVCEHPYWPVAAVERGYPESRRWKEKLAILNGDGPQAERDTLQAMAEAVSAQFEGAWSLDFAVDEDGKWWAIDMAPAERSYHWEGCEFDVWKRPA